MKKKLIFAGLILVVVAWLISGLSPFQLLVSFIAAGAVPGIPITVNPYIMCGLALVGGAILMAKISALELPSNPKQQSSDSISIQITSNTHRRTHKNRRRFTQIAKS